MDGELFQNRVGSLLLIDLSLLIHYQRAEQRIMSFKSTQIKAMTVGFFYISRNVFYSFPEFYENNNYYYMLEGVYHRYSI